MPRSRSWSLESMRALGHALVGAEHAGLGEQLVHERGLAMVDVGDDGDVAKRHNGGSGWRLRPRFAAQYRDECYDRNGKITARDG